MAVGYTSRAEDQDSLLVLLGDPIRGWGFGCGGFGKRLVDGRHCLGIRCAIWHSCDFYFVRIDLIDVVRDLSRKLRRELMISV